MSAQLVDTETHKSIWTQRFDRQLDNIFDIQDEITNAIAAQIAPEIETVEKSRIERAANADIDAWLFFQQGLAQHVLTSKESLHKSVEIMDRVKSLDPKFAPGFALASLARNALAQSFEQEKYDQLVSQAFTDAQTAYALDQHDSYAHHWALVRAYSIQGRFEEAIASGKKAIEANPNHIGGHYGLGMAYTQAGMPHEAIKSLDHAIRISPFDPNMARLLLMHSCAHYLAGNYHECIESGERANALGASAVWTYAILPIAYRRIGDIAMAYKAYAELIKRYPAFSIAVVKSGLRRLRTTGIDPIIEGLRELGVPEE